MGFLFRLLLSDVPDFLTQIPLSIIRSNDSRVGLWLRRKIYRTNCLIDTNVIIKNIWNFSAGSGSALYHGTYILNTNGNFVIGDNSHLGAFCYVNVHFGKIAIEENVAIGPGTKIIAYSNHYAPGEKVTEQKITGNIHIHENVFIGSNCVILPNTIVNSNVVIGAGSLVKGVLEANSVYAGIPCQKIKGDWFSE